MVTNNSFDSEDPLSIADGGTGQAAQTDAFDALSPTTTKGDIIVHNGTDNIRLAVGSNDQILTADSAQASGVKWATGASGGLIVQQVHVASGANASTTSVIPQDDTIPQNTEGAELVTLAITPTSATNLLFIESKVNIGRPGGAAGFTFALFQDTTADALAVISHWPWATGVLDPFYLRYQMTAGTTSSTTFKVRFGPSGSTTTYVSRDSGAADQYGGVCEYGITIWEITV